MKIKNDAAFRSTSNTSENRIITRFLARWKGLEPPTFWFVARHFMQYIMINPAISQFYLCIHHNFI